MLQYQHLFLTIYSVIHIHQHTYEFLSIIILISTAISFICLLGFCLWNSRYNFMMIRFSKNEKRLPRWRLPPRPLRLRGIGASFCGELLQVESLTESSVESYWLDFNMNELQMALDQIHLKWTLVLVSGQFQIENEWTQVVRQ